jgi:hypothetical protein
MLEQQQVQSFFQSRTIQLLIAVLAAYAVKNFGVPLMPTEIQIAVTETLTVAIPILIMGAMWMRTKARDIIDRWF